MHHPAAPTIPSNRNTSMMPIATDPPIPMPPSPISFDLTAELLLDVVVLPEGNDGEGGVREGCAPLVD